MYLATDAIGIKMGVNQRWSHVNPAALTLVDIYNEYRQFYLVLDFDGSVRYLDMETVKATYSQYAGTVTAWLLLIGEATLPVTLTLPNYETRYCQYKDAYRANYKAKTVHRLYGENAAPENRDCLMLTRNSPTTDYDLLYNHCLISVNGFFHQTDTDGVNGLLVLDAGDSMRVSNQNQIGILSFLNVCGLATHPITESMLSKHAENEPYSSSMYLQLPVSAAGKTVGLVIGGYLHMIDSNLLSRTSESELKIDFSNYPILDRYFESRNYLDLSSLGLSSTPEDITQISVDELTSDAVMIKLMTLSQSFIVVMDSTHVFVNKHYVKKTGLPGMYVCYVRPVYPLVVGIGRMPEYWVTQEDGQYSLTVFDGSYRNKIYNTTNPLQLTSVSASDKPTDPEILSGAYFMEIGTDRVLV